jgi:hypothetical protein
LEEFGVFVFPYFGSLGMKKVKNVFKATIVSRWCCSLVLNSSDLLIANIEHSFMAFLCNKGDIAIHKFELPMIYATLP